MNPGRMLWIQLLLFFALAVLSESRTIDKERSDEGSQRQKLDLAFVMDSTGSMGSYITTARANIKSIVDEIITSSNSDVRVAYIEYRDHPPQDQTFVTKAHDFTDSISTMKSWLDASHASGGGDTPEAVAEGLFQTTKLTWSQTSTKIAVLISDAPPHGLVPSMDNSFPNGSPTGHDPMKIVRDIAQMGITLYVIGCEPAISPYKDFFMALDYLTGGQYAPLSRPELLVDIITGGAREELSLQKFEKLVNEEIQKAIAAGGKIDKQQISQNVYNQLVSSGATSTHLVKNNATLEGPTDAAKEIAKATSMAEVRLHFHPQTLDHYYMVGTGGAMTGTGGGTGLHIPFAPLPTAAPGIISGAYTGIGTGTRAFLPSGGTGTGTGTFTSTGGTGTGTGAFFSSGGSLSGSGSSDKYSAVHSGISLDQIDRLVQKGTASIALG